MSEINIVRDKETGEWLVELSIRCKSFSEAEIEATRLCHENDICPECRGEGYIEYMTAPDDSETRKCECKCDDEPDREDE